MNQIYLRSMVDPVARPVPGTENGRFPVFSPDGQWLAFFAGTASPFQLKKVPVAGGAPLTLTSGIRVATTMSWGDDGNLLLGGIDLDRISEAGGQPAVIGKLDAAKGELGFTSPQLLPGGKYILATLVTTKGISDCRLWPSPSRLGKRRCCWRLRESACSHPPVRNRAWATWYTPVTGRCLQPRSTWPRFRSDPRRRSWRACALCWD